MLAHSRNEATDEILDTLSHPLRRRLLFSLYERDSDSGELPLHRVSNLAFEEENVRVELYHVQLPKLEEKGYVCWDGDEDTITEGPEWNQIEPLLRLLYNHLNELPSQLRGTASLP
ncbi:ArsR family transcriptional regulator [Natronococcus sp. JC468]|uniref:ArsR family transcriptional regulator n=1 Tax=Natronococcus sp. JC468 TaxID=1961921 RepID=UPI00143A0E6B|nr:ArsR family transcriptional regulator [Natronococcus sp. JC468]NKE35218.1 ArsR family transcriptional regulator [Natronococcus sp. JC468]